MSSDCSEIASLVASRSLGVLDEGERDALERHLGDCASCGSLAPAFEKSLSLGAERAPADSWEKIRSGLASLSTKREEDDAPLVRLSCTYCHGELVRSSAVYCAACLAPCHEPCFFEHGRCAAPGCSETRIVRACVPAPLVPAMPRVDRPSRAKRLAPILVIGLGLGSAALVAELIRSMEVASQADRDRLEAELTARAERDLKKKLADLLEAGRAKLAKGDLDGALDDFTQALGLDPRNALTLASRGETYRRKGMVDEALDDLVRATALDASSAAAWLSLGSARQDRQDYEGSIEASTRAIELDPTLVAAWIRRGAARALRGDPAAQNDLTRAIQLDPTDATAWSHRAYITFFTGDPQNAQDDAEKALELDPGNALARVVRALFAQKRGDFDGAERLCSMAIELDPRLYPAWFVRASARQAKKDLDGAIADYSRLIELRPSVSHLWIHRALVRREKGDSPSAIADLTRALALMAKTTTDARALLEKDRLAAAIKALERGDPVETPLKKDDDLKGLIEIEPAPGPGRDRQH
ncbi:tetratricopeptide repeat protein [bacterium]|nr:tetratricopeptide repeat protein [bacterium]